MNPSYRPHLLATVFLLGSLVTGGPTRGGPPESGPRRPPSLSTIPGSQLPEAVRAWRDEVLAWVFAHRTDDDARLYAVVVEADGRMLRETRRRGQELLRQHDRGLAAGSLAEYREASERLSAHVQTNPYQYVVDFRDPSFRVEVEPYEALDYRNAFTFAVWIFLQGDARVPQTKIISHAGVNPGKAALMLSADEPEVVLHVGKGRQMSYRGNAPLPHRRWVHLAVSFDARDGCELFVDGVPRPFLLTSSEVAVAPIASRPEEVLYIGGLDRCFPGRLDDVRVYDRRLTEDEIAAILRGHGSTRGLVGWWPLDEVDDGWTPNRVAGGAPGRVGSGVLTGEPGVEGSSGGSFSFSGKPSVWSRRLEALEAAVDSFEMACLAELGDHTVKDLSVGPSPLESLLARLRQAHARLVHYVRLGQPPVIWAFVIDPARDRPIEKVEIGPAGPIAELARRVREELVEVPDLMAPDEQAYREAARALAKRIWDPVASAVGTDRAEPPAGIRETWLRPCGELAAVPFAALVGEDGRYLVEHTAFARTGPVAELGRPRVINPGGVTLAFGNPDFGSRPGKTRPLPWQRTGAERASVETPHPRDPGTGCRTVVSLLYGTRVELDRLHRLFDARGGSFQCLEWSEAYESTFKRNAPGARVLHVASHGYVLDPVCLPTPPRSPFELVGIQLGGVNALRSDDEEHPDDGSLSAAELSRVDLRECELAVFSGCATAGGETIEGEGVCSLNTAAWIAGAGASIGALWSVNDDTVPSWMADFYQAWLEGATVAAAVDRADRAALTRTRLEYGHGHPHAWAAFVVAGL